MAYAPSSHNIPLTLRHSSALASEKTQPAYNQVYNQIVSFIWGIADDCLRDVYVRGKYRDVILPMTVIRRLDAVLEPTKEAVLVMKKNLDKNKITNQTGALCSAAGQAFCNVSPFCLKDLTARSSAAKLKADFSAYLDGFSPNVQEILVKFKFRDQLPTMLDAGILGAVVEKFVSPQINLSPNPVLNEKDEVRLPGLDNHSMGTIFEELIRLFNEENNEEAGEHFTPRDVVELMADVIFAPIAHKILDSTYSCYDGACGTGGMLTVAANRLVELAEKKKKKVSIHLFGQESQPETYAIAKADLLLKGDGEQAENIAYGSTLSNDANPATEFDFMLSNPPYGKAWKTDADKLGGKKGIIDPRFVTNFAGSGDFSMIPRVSDGQLLFLLNNVSKMKKNTPLGSRITEVHNGSSLFTGDAGQGESNARRYMIEKDLVEAIIALPEKMFYNTGIATFIWVLSNKKEKKRQGKIQLIDATSLKTPLRKNLGEKNCELSADIRKQILDLYVQFDDNEYSRVFDSSEFGYWKITVYRPKRDADGKVVKFKKTENQALPAGIRGLAELIEMDKAEKKGIPVIDTNLTDTEQIPFTYEGGIQAFFDKEVLPYSPDAWIDDRQTKIGYEISFTKYFYKPLELRPLEEIAADIKKLEAETKGLLEKIVDGGRC